MRKVIITCILIVSMLSMALVGSCGAFDYIDSVFDEIINGEITESEKPTESAPESEKPMESKPESEKPMESAPEGETPNESDSEIGTPNGSFPEVYRPVDAPDVMTFTYGGVTYVSGSVVKVQNGSYSFKINLSKYDGSEVGDVYGSNYEYTLKATGRYNAVRKTILNGTVTDTVDGVVNLAEQTFNGEKDDFLAAKYIAGVTISDGYLTVGVSKGVTYLPATAVRTGTRYDYDSPYYDPRGGGVADRILLDIIVEDVASGLTGLIILEF